jgi:hypothetical protein
MPRRSLLSAEQRTRLFAIPTTPAEMAKHYVLGPEDLLLVRAKRRAVARQSGWSRASIRMVIRRRLGGMFVAAD